MNLPCWDGSGGLPSGQEDSNPGLPVSPRTLSLVFLTDGRIENAPAQNALWIRSPSRPELHPAGVLLLPGSAWVAVPVWDSVVGSEQNLGLCAVAIVAFSSHGSQAGLSGDQIYRGALQELVNGAPGHLENCLDNGIKLWAGKVQGRVLLYKAKDRADIALFLPIPSLYHVHDHFRDTPCSFSGTPELYTICFCPSWFWA